MTHVADDDPRMALVHALRAVTVELALAGSRFAEQESMHATDVRAMIQILDGNRAGARVSPGWLSGRLGITTAATTSVLDRLQDAGYIRRINDLMDRRRVFIMPNEQAIEVGWRFFGPLIDSMVGALADFDPAEQEVIRRFLAAMDDAISTTLD
jgi:DNA-binding MarR family transcriptional regulator